MTIHGSPEELERRRRRAVALVHEGHSRVEAARMVGARPRSVSRWCQAFEARGEAGLSANPRPGPKPKLSAYRRKLLIKQLLKGAKAHGYPTNLWTCSRIAAVIERRYGIRYHADHVWKLIASLGSSCQKPERRAVERDESAIKQWIARDWRRIKKRHA